MESEVPALKESFSDGDKSGSTSSSNSIKLRKKLENRRSILNQIDDGKIRRKPKVVDQKSNFGERGVGSAPRPKRFDEDSQETIQRMLVSTPPRTTLDISTLSPSPIDNLKRITEVSARSISRKRERKEAAEQRLKGLFSAATLVQTKSEEGSYHYPSALDAQADTMSDNSSRTRRQLFDQDRKQQENDVKIEHDDNIIRPIPKRVTKTDPIANKLNNLNQAWMQDKESVDEVDENVMHNISDQLNIQVHDNFYLFTL